MSQPLARGIPERAIEQREDVGIGERIHPHPDRTVRQRVGFERDPFERRARAEQRHAARDACATLGAAGQPQQ